MLENIAEMFENHKAMMTRLKKAAYKKNMYDFRVNFGEDFQEMLDAVDASEDKSAAAKEIAEEFSNKVFDVYAKNGKVRTAQKADLSFFMIYYIFPAILLTEDKNATLLCDNLRDAWNNKFKEKIGYTDYDTIFAGFREKIFGIF